MTATPARMGAAPSADAEPTPAAGRRWLPARDRAFWLGLAVLLLVGTALRGYRLDALPPGLAYDEAWEGIDGARILAGARPLFLPDNNGREPLFAYTVALWIGLLGHGALAVRAAAATWGALTVAAMAALGGALGGRRLALAAAGLVAVSYWPLHLSRVGIRPVALPPLEALALAALLAALGATLGRGAAQPVAERPSDRTRSPARPDRRPAASARVWLALTAGAALGLALYTYLPARLLVPIAGLAVVVRLVGRLAARDWPGARSVVAVAALAALAAAVVAAPLALHFARHPQDFLGRSDQVTVMNAIRTGADARQVLTENLVATVDALWRRGDAQARHNLPGRPIFDPLGVALFVVGLGALLRRARSTAGAAILASLVVMLVPAWLSDSAPHQLRMAGALPALYLVAALGLATLAGAAGQRGAALIVVALALTGSLTARDYFVRFADPAVSAAPFDADLVTIAGALDASPAGRETLAGPVEAGHPSLRYLLDGEPPTTFPVAATPLRTAGPGGLTYFVRGGPDGDAARLLAAAYPGVAAERLGELSRLTLPAGARPREPAPSRRLDARLGPLTLLGADAGSAPAGAELPLRLYWRAEQAVGERLTVFVHLVDAVGRTWAQEDLEPGGGAFPTLGWPAGQIVADDRRLPLPPGIPPGDYALRVGLVRPGGERLPLAGGGDFATLPGVRVERGAGRLNLWRLPISRVERDLTAGGARVRLVGYRLQRDRVDAGEPLPVLLVWEWAGPAPGLRAELALTGAPEAGGGRAGAPIAVGGDRPIDGWTPGELLQERRELIVPAAAPAGQAAVELRLVGADGARGDSIRLGQIAVETRRRDFAASNPTRPLGVRFGEFAELAGFDLAADRARPGEQLRLRLHWRARATAPENYVVFLHLLDAAEQVRGQRDGPPAEGRAPTRTWLPGETILDERAFAVAADARPGRYRLEVGLYLPATGARVPLTVGGPGDRLLFGDVEIAP